ncbi:hypothetical protein QFC21_000879 [Naganishia friedmannii]|uniref:Uncharacterized protein n=1 Tax=Naganishia friedmannii TaxID=89922 RepID=A0ACC2W7K1_9TREE|nr:hypothetical protein QFC21_000879 [Naganishia friedmannii]
MQEKTEDALLEHGVLPTSLDDRRIDQDGKFDLTTLPQDGNMGEIVPKNAFLSKRTEAIMMTAICTALFVAGWNDASTGPLIPSLQNLYHVNYTVISLLFILNFCGFTSAAVLNVWLTDRLGFGMVILVGAIVQGISFALICWAPPFGLFVFAMYLNGLGTGLQERSSSQKFKKLLSMRRTYLMMAMLGLYVGTEVTIGGWIVTYILKYRGGGVSSGYIATGFWGVPRNFLRELMFSALFSSSEMRSPSISSKNLASMTCSSEAHLFMSSVSLVIVFALEFVVWFVPNIIAEAVAVSFMGMFLGPIFPLVMNVAGKVFPLSMLTGACGLIASILDSVGSAGAALFPFVTGALASKYGVKTMQPFVVAMLAACFLLWIPIPKNAEELPENKKKRSIPLEEVKPAHAATSPDESWNYLASKEA